MAKRPVLVGFIVGSLAIIAFFSVSMMLLHVLPDRRAATFLDGGDIGVVEIKSTIVGSERALDQIKDLRDDRSVRAILVRIDSPGGAVGPAQEIYSELIRTRAVKPVVASLGGTAASGGYYIACAANLIVANPGTLTGSIGAIMEFFNLRGLYQWAGVETDTVKSGPYKDMGNFARGLTGEEKQLLGDVIADVRDQFVDAIAEGRGMPAEQIMPIADGRIFTGQQAKELGLVDRLGNFNDAVAAAAELGGISGEPHLIRFRDKKTDILDLMLDDLIGRLMNTLENRLRDHGPRALPRLNYR